MPAYITRRYIQLRWLLLHAIHAYSKGNRHAHMPACTYVHTCYQSIQDSYIQGSPVCDRQGSMQLAHFLQPIHARVYVKLDQGLKGCH